MVVHIHQHRYPVHTMKMSTCWRCT